jgi:hypothetical protein
MNSDESVVIAKCCSQAPESRLMYMPGNPHVAQAHDAAVPKLISVSIKISISAYIIGAIRGN